jgi:hypothetical protein
VLKFWKRKDEAVKNWRSRAWSIDPNKTKITILVKKRKGLPTSTTLDIQEAVVISNYLIMLCAVRSVFHMLHVAMLH